MYVRGRAVQWSESRLRFVAVTEPPLCGCVHGVLQCNMSVFRGGTLASRCIHDFS